MGGISSAEDGRCDCEDGDDVLPVLEEAHTRADRVVRTASEAVIAGRSGPWIDDSFHDNLNLRAKVQKKNDVSKFSRHFFKAFSFLLKNCTWS